LLLRKTVAIIQDFDMTIDFIARKVESHSERIPRSLLWGMRANQNISSSIGMEDSPQLAAGLFNPKVCALQAAHWGAHPVAIAVPEGSLSRLVP
jgi:hypothetical protein